MINLKSIYDYSKRIIEANKHIGVNNFTKGDVYTVYNTGENTFPAIHASLTELEKDGSLFMYKFNMFYIDRLLENNSNEDEIIDSGYLALSQYLNCLENGFNEINSINLEKNSIYNVFVEDFSDKCAGVWVEVSMSMCDKVGECTDVVVPFNV